MVCTEHPTTGVIKCTFVAHSTCRELFAFLNIDQPVDTPGGDNSPDEIRVCLSRAHDDLWDCDIDLTGSSGEVKMPLKGRIVYKCPIVNFVDVDPADGLPDNAQAVISLAMADGGIMCGTQQLDFQEENFWNDPETVIDMGNRRFSWDMSEVGAEAFFGSNCYMYQKYVHLCISIMVTVFCPAVGEEEQVELHFCSRRNPGDPIDPPYIMDAIRFQNSCVAEGTLIRLPDGRTGPIETLARGTLALTRQGGPALTIVAISKGTESIPMVKLLDDHDHQILVTEGHPVITPRGPVLAWDLRPGDTVLTEVGPTVLVSVTRAAFGGKVYNLNLGTEIERAALSSRDETTMIANGFVIGDERMQTYYKFESLKRPPTTLADIAPNWRQDYLNSLRRRGGQAVTE